MLEPVSEGQDIAEDNSNFSELAPMIDSVLDSNEMNSGIFPETTANPESEKVLFTKSTDIRRKIEEQMEVKLLRDQLGLDDFDLI